MFQSGPVAGGQLGLRGLRVIDARERLIAGVAVLALHGAAGGALIIAQMHRPIDPPEPVLTVSFITDAAARAAAAPAQPAPPLTPPPEPTLVATSRPTESPMTAPPVEREVVRPTLPQPAAQVPAAAPAPPSPSVAPATAPGPAGAEPAEAYTPPNFSAAYLNNPGAAYPVAARRRRDQGIVRLRVEVGADGSVDQVLLDRTSGHPDLDAAALDVVRKRWRFAPAKQGDRAVSAWVIVPMEFLLKDR